LQFHGLDGTRTDINANHAFISTLPHHE
jgi:hypothetical protein